MYQRTNSGCVGEKNEFCQGFYFQMFVVAQMCSNHSTELEGFLAVKSWWNTLLTQMRACIKQKEGRFFYIDNSVSGSGSDKRKYTSNLSLSH